MYFLLRKRNRESLTEPLKLAIKRLSYNLNADERRQLHTGIAKTQRGRRSIDSPDFYLIPDLEKGAIDCYLSGFSGLVSRRAGGAEGRPLNPPVSFQEFWQSPVSFDAELVEGSLVIIYLLPLSQSLTFPAFPISLSPYILDSRAKDCLL